MSAKPILFKAPMDRAKQKIADAFSVKNSGVVTDLRHIEQNFDQVKNRLSALRGSLETIITERAKE